MSPLERAIEAVGGATALARLLKVEPAAVTNWKRRGVPPDRVIAVEKACAGAVHRSEIRPDIYPPDEYLIEMRLLTPGESEAA
ncbi:MAG: transcriptional regulator [Pseudomonadota bacterium]